MMERRFIKSGIPGLDEVLGGGLLEGSIVTVSGPTGGGKSTLAAQFIHNGAVESGEPGLYISIEESRGDFFFHMNGYSWDFAGLEKARKFVLLDYPIHEVDQIISQSGAIGEIISTTGTKRVVIDSIMPIALFFKSDDERRKGFLKFIENLRKWGTTTIIVSEDLKMAENTPATEYGIESFTDGWINLTFRYDDAKKERVRYLEVIKMKGVPHSSKSYPVTLDDSGFRIGSGPAPERPKPPEKAVEKERPAEKLRTLAAPKAPQVEKEAPKPDKPEKKPGEKPLKASDIAARLDAVKSRLAKKTK
jgi:circadian clock protein KaiC